jgi:glycosyltransferase involved in cell wall biosynthesis
MFPNIKFVQTAVFGDKNDQFQPDAIINVSRHVQHIKGDAGKENYYVIRNPVDDVFTDEDLREEFGIPKDALVFGRIGRSDAAIYTSINLDAYARVQTDDTYFISVNPSEAMLKDVKALGIKNFIAMDRTTDKVRLSKFYNTIDVLAHARKDGECCPANVAEAFAHGVPVISHYGYPYNGHLENIQDAGFTVLPDDVDEYTRIMKRFIDKEVDYKTLSKNARYRYECDYNPKDRANQQLEIYKKVLNN